MLKVIRSIVSICNYLLWKIYFVFQKNIYISQIIIKYYMCGNLWFFRDLYKTSVSKVDNIKL